MRTWMTSLFIAIGIAWSAAPDVAADADKPRDVAAQEAGTAGKAADCHRRIKELKNRLDYKPGNGGLTKGTTVKTEDGQTHTYAGSGPVEPVESWFDSSPRPTANAIHALDSAIAARQEGDMNRCRDYVGEAERILADAERPEKSGR